MNIFVGKLFTFNVSDSVADVYLNDIPKLNFYFMAAEFETTSLIVYI